MIDHSSRFRLANSLPPALGIRAELARAEVAQRQGLFLEAVQVLRRAASAWPGDHRVLANLGNALLRLDDRPGAEQYYRAALGADPTAPSVWNNLGNVLLEQNRIEEAAACYQSAVKLKPDYATAHNSLGHIH